MVHGPVTGFRARGFNPHKRLVTWSSCVGLSRGSGLQAEQEVCRALRIEPDGAPDFRAGTSHSFQNRLAGFASPRIWAILKPARFYMYFARAEDVFRMTDDQRAIRELVDTWLAASKAGDLATVLSLIKDDAIFMVPGRKPFGIARIGSECYKSLKLVAAYTIVRISDPQW
jgi:hypothetical protein